MPKATLTFDLEQPQERREHLAAVQGMDWACMVSEMFNWLRRRDKSAKPEITTDNVRDWLNGEIEERGLNLDVVT